MPAQRLEFDIFAKDSASRGFLDAGRAAAAASDDVMGLARRLDEISKKSATARVELAGNKEAQAELDKLDLKLLTTGRRVVDPKISIDGAAKASLEITSLDIQLDKLAAKSTEATAATGAGGLSGAQGLGALIGAGVILSPVIATLGTGLAGFGLAAAGTVAPIAKAAQATGGLKDNMAALDPEQRDLAASVLGLGKQYDAFQNALQPQVIKVFGDAVRIAGHLMADIEPVAKATGGAFDSFLTQFGVTLQDPQWKNFWAFMAQTAPQDMRLLGQTFIDLTNSLPPLLHSLQPVAVDLLHVADASAKVVTFAARVGDSFSTGSQVNKGFLTVHGTLGRIVNDIDTVILGSYKLPGATRAAAQGMKPWAAASRVLGEHLAAVAGDVTAVMTAEQNALGIQNAYAGSTVAAAQDALNLRDALKRSAGGIGLQTQAQITSFKYANQYISDLGSQAANAYKSGHGVDAATRAIRDGLPMLDAVKGKTRAYRDELAVLKQWLDKLRAEKSIRELVIVTGQGTWTMHNPKGQSLPGGWPGAVGPAKGWRVPGFGGGDRWPALLEGGETVVPKHLTPQIAPLMAKHRVPGFGVPGPPPWLGMTQGGIAGDFAGSVAGTGRWAAMDNRASVRDLEAGLTNIMVTAIRAAQKQQLGGFGGGGPAGGDPAANAAIARRMFPGWASGANWAAWNYVAMRESGWNRFARNPSSGAYGIPQALPPTKMPFAAQAAGGSHAGPQIGWMGGYMLGRYGGPIGAAAHERAFNWYDSGTQFLPQGLSLALNTTGRPERVGGEDLGPLLRKVIKQNARLIALAETAPAAQARATTRALNGLRIPAPRPRGA